jgi:hypothetical protein
VDSLTEMRSILDLLDELRWAINETPRKRLHVASDSAPWISVSVGNTGLSDHVTVVPDPACEHLDQGWVENLTIEQWAQMRALVGQAVTVEDARIGSIRGTLRALDHRTAEVDLGGGDVRYLMWITVTSRA